MVSDIADVSSTFPKSGRSAPTLLSGTLGPTRCFNPGKTLQKGTCVPLPPPASASGPPATLRQAFRSCSRGRPADADTRAQPGAPACQTLSLCAREACAAPPSVIAREKAISPPGASALFHGDAASLHGAPDLLLPLCPHPDNTTTLKKKTLKNRM